MRTVGAGIFLVVILIISGCTTVETDTNDAELVQDRPTHEPTELPLEVTTDLDDRHSKDLALVLAQAEERTITLDRLTAPLIRRGLSEKAAFDTICITLGQVVLQGPALSRELLFRIVLSNLITSFRGDQIAALAAGQGIVNELSDGTADDPLWARAALSKSGHCSPKKSWTDSSTAVG